MGLLIGNLKEEDWKKLLKRSFNQDVSVAFIKCADMQLSSLFENQTDISLSKNKNIALNWSALEPFLYTAGAVARLSAQILLINGVGKTDICWKSKSGRQYNIDDEDIDCNDIEFWFEGLDPEFCKQRVNPKWSLFPFPELSVEQFEQKFGLPISKQFIVSADKQLSPQFELETGLKMHRNIAVTWDDYSNHPTSDYKIGNISKMPVCISIAPHSNSGVLICWESKSGRIYELATQDIDVNDIKFCFEGLNPLEYQKQFFPNNPLPFELKNLTYVLQISRIDVNCVVHLQLKEDAIDKSIELVKDIDNYIADFNKKSEKKNRKDGVVHNWKHKENGNELDYEIDTGSAGVPFLKRFLIFLSELKCFRKVELG